ncbi:MAG: 50S ribosomal protein L9 [Actinomycetota bacterium]
MKLVLSADVEGLGRKGDIVEVASGYARNFLLPKKLGLQATQGTIKQAETMRRAREEGENRDRRSAEDLAGRIARAKLVIAARAGEEGHLFGSVTTSDIADRLEESLGEEVDRRKIHVGEPVRSLGVHEFSVHLRPDVTALGSVEVVPID